MVRRSTKTLVDLAVADTIARLGQRVRNIESDTVYSPVRYTMQEGGYLVDDTAVGATTLTVSALPQGSINHTIWIAIDTGNAECEFRKCITVDESTGIVTFTNALEYVHNEGDTVVVLREARLNVAWWGAKGDALVASSATNYFAVARAIVQLKWIGSPGGVLYFPAGDYYTNRMWTFTVGKFSVEGESVNNTTIAVDTSGAGYTGTSIMRVAGTIGSHIANCVIRNIFFYGVAASTVNCVELVYCDWVSVLLCQLWSNDTTSVGWGQGCGIYASACQNLRIDGCEARSNVMGILVDGVSNRVSITNNYFYNNVTNIFTWATTGLITSGNHYPPISGMPVMSWGFGTGGTGNYYHIGEAVSEWLGPNDFEPTVVDGGGYPLLDTVYAGHPKAWVFKRASYDGIGCWLRPNDEFVFNYRYAFKLYWTVPVLAGGNVDWFLSLSPNPWQSIMIAAFNPVVAA